MKKPKNQLKTKDSSSIPKKKEMKDLNTPTATQSAVRLSPISTRPRHQKNLYHLDQLAYNRDLSWLTFNNRVLYQAQDQRHPLGEQIKFLSISISNLDEFFMKRIGELRKSSGRNSKILTKVREKTTKMVRTQKKIWVEHLKPQLENHGIHLVKITKLNVHERTWTENYFKKKVFPVLTPLSVDPGHPFPFISNLSTSIGVVLRSPGDGKRLFARVKIPQVLPQWIKLEGGKPTRGIQKYIALTDLIQNHLDLLFPKMIIEDFMFFRLTRNAEIEVDDEDIDDLLETVEEQVRLRKFSEVVRMEYSPPKNNWLIRFLKKELELCDSDIFEGHQDIHFGNLNAIDWSEHPELLYRPFIPAPYLPFAGKTPQEIFSLVKEKSQLVHHPFQSFTESVQKFLEAAVSDPQVLAIKLTLYRTEDKSPIVALLKQAAERGKQVVCFIELKARFDEERNMTWAEELESSGVHVVYGLVGLKIHAKVMLVVRKEADELRTYFHIGTGNYNSITAKVYTDFSYFSSNPQVGEELIEIFNYLTGRSLKRDYRHILIAPFNMAEHFKKLIYKEQAFAKKGLPALIIAKMNAFYENTLAETLYQASSAGVEIKLLVRGFCTLAAGVPGVSEKIQVLSTIGRFLEHHRVYYFRQGAKNPLDGLFFLGSADWMYRNLYNRVEVIVPILEPELKAQLWETLRAYEQDQAQTWELLPNGRYRLRKRKKQGVQEKLIETYSAQNEIGGSHSNHTYVTALPQKN